MLACGITERKFLNRVEWKVELMEPAWTGRIRLHDDAFFFLWVNSYMMMMMVKKITVLLMQAQPWIRSLDFNSSTE